MKLRHIVLLCFSLPGLAGAPCHPHRPSRSATTIDGILLILQDGTLTRETRWERIGALIQSRFDFESMSQRVLSTNWKKGDPRGAAPVRGVLLAVSGRHYRSKIEAYTDEQVRYVGEKIKGERAVVDTTIVTDTAEIPVSYKLKQTDGEWLGVDVVIENVSLVSNYRNTFAAIVKTEGMEGLLNDLQRRIARQKSLQTRLAPPTGAPGARHAKRVIPAMALGSSTFEYRRLAPKLTGGPPRPTIGPRFHIR